MYKHQVTPNLINKYKKMKIQNFLIHKMYKYQVKDHC